ncbi:MAG: single-stranded DNA-binding protein [Pseudomonadota bacterium]
MLNQAQIIGHVGQDPDIRTLNNGNPVANFTVATSKHWKDRETGEKRELTEWHRVTVMAEGLCGVVKDHVRKGTQLYVQGELRTRKWTDQNDIERWSTEILVGQFGGKLQLLGKKSGGNLNDMSASAAQQDMDDDIPF